MKDPEQEQGIDQDIINPEIPQTPQEKYALMQLCVDALRAGKKVEGVTNHHITPDGMRMLTRACSQPQLPQY